MTKIFHSVGKEKLGISHFPLIEVIAPYRPVYLHYPPRGAISFISRPPGDIRRQAEPYDSPSAGGEKGIFIARLEGVLPLICEGSASRRPASSDRTPGRPRHRPWAEPIPSAARRAVRCPA